MLSHKYKSATTANLSLCMLEVRVNASYEQDHIMATINVNGTYSVFICPHTQNHSTPRGNSTSQCILLFYPCSEESPSTATVHKIGLH
jgi:hypothetical protein